MEALFNEAWCVVWKLCPMRPGWHRCGGFLVGVGVEAWLVSVYYEAWVDVGVGTSLSGGRG